MKILLLPSLLNMIIGSAVGGSVVGGLPDLLRQRHTIFTTHISKNSSKTQSGGKLYSRLMFS